MQHPNGATRPMKPTILMAPALPAACVAWGRSLAGLPPLPHASGGA